MHGFDYSLPRFTTHARGTRIVVTSDLISEVLHVPGVEFADYLGCPHLKAMSKDKQYDEFLREQGFEDFLQIPPYTMSHGIWETLVRWFHTEMGTFHLSYGEYTILPLDWIAILGIRFGGYPISTHEMSFEMASELLGIPLPLIANMRGYFEPTTSP